MKTLFVLSSLLVILAIGLSYDSLSFGDHTKPVELTFNQESYEYGDTMIVTAKLPAPFESANKDKGTELHMRGSGSLDSFNPRLPVNSTGYAVFVAPLTSKEITSGVGGFRSTFLMYLEDGKLTQHRNYHIEKTMVNSDVATITLDHMKTLKTLNSTVTKDHKQMSFIQSSLKHFDDALITMSGIFHIERLDIDKLQNFTSSLSKKLGFAIDDIELLLDSSKSMQKEIDLLKKQVAKNTNHGNNGTKHHSHP